MKIQKLRRYMKNYNDQIKEKFQNIITNEEYKKLSIFIKLN